MLCQLGIELMGAEKTVLHSIGRITTFFKKLVHLCGSAGIIPTQIIKAEPQRCASFFFFLKKDGYILPLLYRRAAKPEFSFSTLTGY